jgi:hypothetical protein
VSFLVGLGAVLHAPRHDEQLALPQLDVAVSKVDGQAPAHDEEEVVGLVVLVPDERPLHLDDLQLEVVQVADDPGLVGLAQELELLGEVDLVFQASTPDKPV